MHKLEIASKETIEDLTHYDIYREIPVEELDHDTTKVFHYDGKQYEFIWWLSSRTCEKTLDRAKACFGEGGYIITKTTKKVESKIELIQLSDNKQHATL